MAGGLQTGGDPDDINETHEINVTPFIDVMLVLLIIFMVAAPLATADVKVDLPTVTAASELRPDKPVFLTLEADLSLSVGEAPVERQRLKPVLDALTNGDAEARLFVRADRKVDYGALMDLMNDLRRAGYLKVALVGLERPGVAPVTPQ